MNSCSSFDACATASVLPLDVLYRTTAFLLSPNQLVAHASEVKSTIKPCFPCKSCCGSGNRGDRKAW